jgi:hypothetical protein
MTGKCQLSGGSEDAYASIAVLGRKQEDGLGQIPTGMLAKCAATSVFTPTLAPGLHRRRLSSGP